MASTPIVVRRSEVDDVEWVARLAASVSSPHVWHHRWRVRLTRGVHAACFVQERSLLRQRFGDFDIASLIEQSYLSITALNSSGEVQNKTRQLVVVSVTGARGA